MFHVLTTVKLFSPTLYRIFSPLYIILYHIMSYHISYYIAILEYFGGKVWSGSRRVLRSHHYVLVS